MISVRGQGTLEYLLIIGGSVLVATIILIIALQTAPEGNIFLANNIGTYQTHISLGGSSGSTSDTTPPNVTFSIAAGDAQMNITYSGTDANPITYTVIYSDVSTDVSAVLDFDNLSANPNVRYVRSTTPPILALHNVSNSGVFTQTGLTNGTTYYYRWRACDSLVNCSTSAAPLSDTPSSGGGSGDTTAPNISDFTISPRNNASAITFLATDPAIPNGPSNPVSYTVIFGQNQTAVDGSSFSGTLPPGVNYVFGPSTTTSYTSAAPYLHTGLTNGQTNFYRLQACDAANNCAVYPTTLSVTPSFPTITVALLGVEETVYDYPSQACNTTQNFWDFPDSMAHAIHLPNNNILLSAGNSPGNYYSYGSTFNNLTRQCPGLLSSLLSPNPNTFKNQEWVNSIFLDSTGKIHALIHNEYHDADPTVVNPLYPCGTDPFSSPCIYDGVTYASSVSTNPPFQFAHPATNYLVSAGPHTYNWQLMNVGPQCIPDIDYPNCPGGAVNMCTFGNPPRNGCQGYLVHQYGQMVPSNIIPKVEGATTYYYSMINAHNVPGSPSSVSCVIRTSNLNDPSSWRGMDASGSFTIAMPSPYVSPGATPCTPTNGNMGLFGSITYNKYFESLGLPKYLLVGDSQLNGCGFSFSLSDDLINWTTPRLLLDTPLVYCGGGSNSDARAYSSIIDHTQITDPTNPWFQNDPNFLNSGQTPFVYFARFQDVLVPLQFNRDLGRQQIQFNVTWP